ncbi:hypothetical protein HGRIS_008106 [Hohenbuehelia grisea]|uniref:UBC core domain-containing protein n=1 Tax=Hohenbuehelia grisea TaxID=104357 RepID=A0ABR3J703_9AGAR
MDKHIEAQVGEFVLYNDWVGQIVETADESLIERSTGNVVPHVELGSRLNVGDTGSPLIPPRQDNANFLLSFFIPNIADPGSGKETVIFAKHTVYAICWLAVNQSLDANEAQSRQRPPRLWSGPELTKLVLLRMAIDVEMHVGAHMNFKNPLGFPFTTHVTSSEGTIRAITSQTFVVIDTQTTLSILWQDGTKETLDATQAVPYANPDEYDCWPGDHVIWKGEEGEHPAVVQSVDAVERTASVLFPSEGTVELVSLLELDPHGVSDLEGHALSDGLGVARGDLVFIHPPGHTNGLQPPHVPRIGEVEPWAQDPMPMDGQLSGWRLDMTQMAAAIMMARIMINGPMDAVQMTQSSDSEAIFNWFGEVRNLRLDGLIEVMHPDRSIAIYPLQRLTKLYDAMHQFEDGLFDEDSEEYYSDEEMDASEVYTMDENGQWQPDENGEEWEEMDTDDDGDIAIENVQSDIETTSNLQPPSPIVQVKPANLSQAPSAARTANSTSNEEDELEETNKAETSHWTRFQVLPSAPVDHAFYNTPPAQTSKPFFTRIAREYKILTSSLPDSILVRTYEDRSDLLRSLIIGPEHTPYEDAPFVIDWMLDSNFPNNPPIAHFHSWTTGNGRVNPNLYEEGKVCLSILGTWSGDKSESWNAARSSLLQALVSIQGLVLVKEPWYCEPAYEKLRGTEDGTVNSRLYSEKAYVLSRAFVRRALEVPVGGLEAEIDWLYITNGRLRKVVEKTRALIEHSRAPSSASTSKSPESSALSGPDSELAVPRLTAGGIIPLERTLNKLQALLEARSDASSGAA